MVGHTFDVGKTGVSGIKRVSVFPAPRGEYKNGFSLMSDGSQYIGSLSALSSMGLDCEAGRLVA
jgi:hypothetical protein